ncbi:phage tail tape measure protein [Streptobacillus moniliformis]|uniref:phage tail tape measure protein n=1 Tax=Streptobacillus moniliformis TaxID=34105 RepID=UPI0007E34664|nr:phage tail tape measure protein [Streptobacillus moniliformis]QXW65662.1 phage tail tape measure protein [Streptobacillus moniliformis]
MAKNMEFNLVLGVAAAGALTSLAKAGNAFKELTLKAEELDSNLKKLSDSQEKLKNVKNSLQGYKNLSNEYVRAVTKLNELKKAHEKTGKSNAGLSKKIKEQMSLIDKLNKKKEYQKKVFKAARSEIEKEGYSIKKYSKHIDALNRKIKFQTIRKKINNFYDGVDNVVGNISNFADKRLSVGTRFGAVVGLPVKIYMDIEESQADLRKMLGDEAKKYYSNLRKISDNSPLSQVEIFEISGALAQSGIKGEELVEYTKKAQQIAVAFDLGTKEAGEFLAKTKNQLQLGQKELFKYADTINYLSDNTASKAHEIVEISQRVASLGGVAGISHEAVASFGATLLSVGKTPEIASTGLKKLYTGLVSGTAATKAQRDAFALLGTDTMTLAKSMKENGEETVIAVLSRLKELPKHMQVSTIKQIFGSEALDSITGMMANVEMLKQNLEKAKSAQAQGAVEAEYKNRLDTLKSDMLIVKNKLFNALADAGKALAPVIKNLLVSITPFIEKLARFVENNPKFVENFLKALGVMALFNIVVGIALKGLVSLISSFISISKAITYFVNVLSFTIKGFKFLISFLPSVIGVFKSLFGILKAVSIVIKTFFVANPLVLIGVIVVAVVSGLVLMYKKFAWFRNFVNKIWTGIKFGAVYVFQKIKNGVVAVFDGIKGAIVIIVEKCKQLFMGLFSWISKGWQGIKNTVSKVGSWINPFNWGKNYSGTNYWGGGLTTVAERGAELINYGGSSILATSSMLLNLPKGTNILNNSQTRSTLQDKVNSLKTNASNTIQDIKTSGDNLNFYITGQDPKEIAREVLKIINENNNRKRRVAFD